MKVAYAIALPFAIGLAIASLSQLAAAGSPDPSFAGHIDAMVNQGLAAQAVADKAGPAGTAGQGGHPDPSFAGTVDADVNRGLAAGGYVQPDNSFAGRTDAMVNQGLRK